MKLSSPVDALAGHELALIDVAVAIGQRMSVAQSALSLVGVGALSSVQARGHDQESHGTRRTTPATEPRMAYVPVWRRGPSARRWAQAAGRGRFRFAWRDRNPVQDNPSMAAAFGARGAEAGPQELPQ